MATRKLTWDRTKGRPEPIQALNKIPELENNDPMVDILVACPSVILIREGAITYVRKQVAIMLEAAAKSLPSGYHLGLIEAWRPLERQQFIYDFWYEGAKEAFPNRDHTALRRTACRWAAPTDQKAPPGHCTGAAIDLNLVHADGEPYDVNSPFERFQAAPTYAFGLSEEAHKNRMLLVESMLAQGFSNCRDEYWHYSYGDAGWAVRLDKKECFYGLVKLPEELYQEKQRIWLEAMGERHNPFLDPPKKS